MKGDAGEGKYSSQRKEQQRTVMFSPLFMILGTSMNAVGQQTIDLDKPVITDLSV